VTCYQSASGRPLRVWRCDEQCRHGLPMPPYAHDVCKNSEDLKSDVRPLKLGNEREKN
jgi:hypothetical protein